MEDELTATMGGLQLSGAQCPPASAGPLANATLAGMDDVLEALREVGRAPWLVNACRGDARLPPPSSTATCCRPST